MRMSFFHQFILYLVLVLILVFCCLVFVRTFERLSWCGVLPYLMRIWLEDWGFVMDGMGRDGGEGCYYTLDELRNPMKERKNKSIILMKCSIQKCMI